MHFFRQPLLLKAMIQVKLGLLSVVFRLDWNIHGRAGEVSHIWYTRVKNGLVLATHFLADDCGGGRLRGQAFDILQIGDVQFPLGVENQEKGVSSDDVAIRLEGSEGHKLKVAGGGLLFLELEYRHFWVREEIPSCSPMAMYSCDSTCLRRTSAPKTTGVVALPSKLYRPFLGSMVNCDSISSLLLER